MANTIGNAVFYLVWIPTFLLINKWLTKGVVWTRFWRVLAAFAFSYFIVLIGGIVVGLITAAAK